MIKDCFYKMKFLKIIKGFWVNRNLIAQFTKRDVISRYKGSYLGIIWSFLNPLLMLAVYTFVFSEVFQAKWGTGSGNKLEFALLIFCGLVTFNIFGELIGRAPSLIINHGNYVTKVVFPLEILPLAVMGSSLVHSLISFFILITGCLFAFGTLHWTIIFIPLILIPLILLALGIGYFLASLGVYLRDIGQFVGIAIQALMLLSPIFYSVSSLPEKFQTLFSLNPISYVVEDMRQVIIWGTLPHFNWMAIEFIISIFVFWLGYAWFEKTKKGFADVM